MLYCVLYVINYTKAIYNKYILLKKQYLYIFLLHLLHTCQIGCLIFGGNILRDLYNFGIFIVW